MKTKKIIVRAFTYIFMLSNYGDNLFNPSSGARRKRFALKRRRKSIAESHRR